MMQNPTTRFGSGCGVQAMLAHFQALSELQSWRFWGYRKSARAAARFQESEKVPRRRQRLEWSCVAFLPFTAMPLAQLRAAFDDPGWIFELKYDGFALWRTPAATADAGWSPATATRSRPF